MKLLQIKPSQTLEEGLRFGARERQALKRGLDQVRIGIEYEYHVSEAYIDNSHDVVAEKRQAYFETRTKEYLEDNEAPLNTLGAAVNFFLKERNGLKQYNDWLFGDYERFYELLSSIETLSPEEFDKNKGFIQQSLIILDNVFELCDNANEHLKDVPYDVDELDQYFEKTSELGAALEEISGAIATILEIEVPNFAGLSSHENQIIIFDEYKSDLAKLAEQIEDLEHKTDNLYVYLKEIHDAYGNADIYGLFELAVKPDIESEWEDELQLLMRYDSSVNNSSSEAAVESITAMLNTNNKWGIKWSNITNVVTDASVEQGVEVITRPLPYHDAIDMMGKMFEHIKEVGHTSNKTGMHVNISIKGLDFSDDNFDPLKATLLLNNRHVLERFPVREHVENIWSNISAKDILEMAKKGSVANVVKGNRRTFRTDVRAIRNSLRHHVKTAGKYRGINYGNMHEYDAETRRLEFRYTGGADYEFRQDEIVDFIERYVYVTLATFDAQFGVKEYHKEMAKLLDVKTDEQFGVDFNMLSKFVRSFKGNPTVEDAWKHFNDELGFTPNRNARY